MRAWRQRANARAAAAQPAAASRAPVRVLCAMAITAWVAPLNAQQLFDPEATLRADPEWFAQDCVTKRNWKAVDELVERLAASGERDADGRYQLERAVLGISYGLGSTPAAAGPALLADLARYQAASPTSALAPILASLQTRTAAWRARGSGSLATVLPEGAELFHARSLEASRALQSAKATASRLPIWYEQAILAGQDAGAPTDELLRIFHEGAARFPDYVPIYTAAARLFSPRFGGDYAAADTFVQLAVALRQPPESEILYAQLYRRIDEYAGQDADFFEASRVSWPLMRAGFEQLLKAYPTGRINAAVFASFACRAGDADTYRKLRQDILSGEFRAASPEGISVDVCDAKFLTQV